ncbi:hypothetical protein SAY86_030344 [Trapa natans]|uniref:DNL-type domain-containing protein n=1 Tax=Trapa natans TaxID=22666 RepID=A0AAN7RIC2_TRANT|nr:hypothetical protein SAY86_030344 [Trapa natans]
MEALTRASIVPASPASLSVFSLKRNLSPRRLRLPFASMSKDNNSEVNPGSEDRSITPISNDSRFSLSPLSKDAAMGLVLNAAVGRGWTTGSGMEGPSVPADTGTENILTFPFSLFTKSPRRRMLVAFSCNICQQRTTRAINPHAYSDGTVFVQCCGCNAYHKLVDNLNLFHEMKCYIGPSFNYKGSNLDVNVNFMEDEASDDNTFPLQ